MARIFLATKKNQKAADDAVSRLNKAFPNKGKIVTEPQDDQTVRVHVEIESLDMPTEKAMRLEAQSGVQSEPQAEQHHD